MSTNIETNVAPEVATEEQLLAQKNILLNEVKELEEKEAQLLALKKQLTEKGGEDKEAIKEVVKEIEVVDSKKKEEIKKIDDKKKQLNQVIKSNLLKLTKSIKKLFGSKELSEVERKAMERGPAGSKIYTLLKNIAQIENQREIYLGNVKNKANPETLKDFDNKIAKEAEQIRALSEEYEIYGPEIKAAINSINKSNEQVGEMDKLKISLSPEMIAEQSVVANLEKKLVKLQKDGGSIEKIEALIKKIQAGKAKIQNYLDGVSDEKKNAKVVGGNEKEAIIVGNNEGQTKGLIKVKEDVENRKLEIYKKLANQELSTIHVTKDVGLEDKKSIDVIIPNVKTSIESTEPIKNTAESNNDLAKFMESVKARGMGNLAEQAAGLVPGFSALPDGQKMLVIQGMDDELLNYVKQKATEKFNEQMASKGKFGKVMLSVRKNYFNRKFQKEELNLIKGNKNESAVARMDFINQKVPGLVKVFGESGVDAYLDKDGKTVITDFANRKNLEGASEYMKKSAERYNKLANKLAHTPQENKAQYEQAEKEFEKARDVYLVELQQHEAAKGNKDANTASAEYMKRAGLLMKTMSFLSADQNTARRLGSIANNPVLFQMAKDIVMERGLMTAGGAAARMGTKAAIYAVLGTAAAATAPVTGAVVLACGSAVAISGIVGYLRGKKRAEKALAEKDRAARRGEKEKGNTAIGMGNVKRHLDRIHKLKSEILSADTSEIKKRELMEQLRTVTDFVGAKMQLRQINFGKDTKDTPVENRVFVMQNRLMNELHESYTLMSIDPELDTYKNIFDNNASGAELGGTDSRTRRLIRVHGSRNAQKAEEARDKEVKHKAKLSAFYGAAFATAGVAIGEAAEHFHWKENIGEFFGHHADGTNPNVAPGGKPEGWHTPMVMPGNQNGVPGGNGGSGTWEDPFKQFRGDGTHGAEHTGTGTGNHPGDHVRHEGTGGHHRVPGHKVHDTSEDISHAPKKAFPIETPEGIPTENEAGIFPFTKAQLDGIREHSMGLMDDKIKLMGPEFTRYFQSAPADDFLDYKPEDITDPQAVKLLNEMLELQKLLGTKPKIGQSVQQYYAHMVEYKDRADIIIQIKKGMNPFPTDDVVASNVEAEPVASPVSYEEVPNTPDMNHVATDEEIMNHSFSAEDNDVIRRLAEHNRGEDMKRFFEKHPNWLDKSAKHIANRNESGVWNPTKRELDAYMSDFAEQTGHFPQKGQSVEEYLRFIEEYNARRDFLNGNYSDDALNGAPMNNVPVNNEALNSTFHEAAQNGAPDADVQEWYNKSLDEYFHGKGRPWHRIGKLKVEDFLNRKHPGRRVSEIHDDLIKYLSQHDDIQVYEGETMEELMKDIALNHKDDPFLKEMIERGSSSQDFANEVENSSSFSRTGSTINAAENVASPVASIENTPSAFQSGNTMIESHLNTLDHTYNQADFSKHIELLQRTDLQDAGVTHMNEFIKDHGVKIWDGIRDMNVKEFASMNRPTGNAGEFYDLISVLKNSDSRLFANSTSVEDFMTQVYIKDELIKYYKENLAVDAVNASAVK